MRNLYGAVSVSGSDLERYLQNCAQICASRLMQRPAPPMRLQMSSRLRQQYCYADQDIGNDLMLALLISGKNTQPGAATGESCRLR